VALIDQGVTTNIIGAALELRREDVVDAVMGELRVRSAIHRAADSELLDAVREQVGEHHDFLCAALRQRTPVEPAKLRFPGRHAALLARRGLSVADVLEGFSCYQDVVWDAVVAIHAEADVPGTELLAVARAMSEHIHAMSAEASSSYRDAAEVLDQDDRVPRELLEDLLMGRSPSCTATLAMSRTAGLDGSARCLVISALPAVTPADPLMLRLAASAFANAIDGCRAPLAVTRGDEIVIVTALAGDERPSLSAPLRNARDRLAAQGLLLSVGISTVHDDAITLGDAYREASAAVAYAGDHGGVLSLPDITAFDYLMLREDAVARRLIDPEIEQFIAEDRECGGTLARTVLSYAESDLNAKVAAEALFIHVNTAHHRLARIAERTGRDLRKLGDVIELLIAIRLSGASQG
jgi:sugar diacid utilization regulator